MIWLKPSFLNSKQKKGLGHRFAMTQPPRYAHAKGGPWADSSANEGSPAFKW